jgi:hypothetical protein
MTHPHPLTAKITLLRLQIFPGCPRCATPVKFAIVSGPARESASGRFRLLMGSRLAQIKRRNSIYR